MKLKLKLTNHLKRIEVVLGTKAPIYYAPLMEESRIENIY